jgi:hypothetical protein
LKQAWECKQHKWLKQRGLAIPWVLVRFYFVTQKLEWKMDFSFDPRLFYLGLSGYSPSCSLSCFLFLSLVSHFARTLVLFLVWGCGLFIVSKQKKNVSWKMLNLGESRRVFLLDVGDTVHRKKKWSLNLEI